SGTKSLTLLEDGESKGGNISPQPSSSATPQKIIELDEEESTDEAVLEDSNEDDDEIHDDINNIDLSIIPTLPIAEQHRVLVKLRESDRNFNREELIPVAGDPAKYSSTQLQHFLKGARRRREINEMQKRVSSNRQGGGSRI